MIEKTLRWLLNAQKQPHSPPPTEEDTDIESVPSPEMSDKIPDPHQQTLHNFFRPTRPSSLGAWESLEDASTKDTYRKATFFQGSSISRKILDIDSTPCPIVNDANSSNGAITYDTMDSEMGNVTGQTVPILTRRDGYSRCGPQQQLPQSIWPYG